MKNPIALKYKIPVTGKYTKGVYTCPHCGNNMLDRYFQSIIGFADAYVGLVAIVECDRCFEKFYSHARDAYEYFLESIAVGDHKHFTKSQKKAMNLHTDKHVGVSGAKIHWMHSAYGKNRWWCRMAISIMGSYNMTGEEIATISPFDPKFYDNYVEGKGATKEEALAEMEKAMEEIADSLWAI